MNQLSKTIKGTIAAGVILLVLACLYAYIWMSIEKGIAESDKLSADLAASTATEMNAKNAESLLIELSGEKSLLESAFLDDDKLVGFLEQIEGLGTTTGSKVKVLSVDSSGDKQSYKFSISVEGTWSSTYRVLTLIEDSPIPVIVNTARLEHSGGDTTRWQELIDFTAPHLPQ